MPIIFVVFLRELQAVLPLKEKIMMYLKKINMALEPQVIFLETTDKAADFDGFLNFNANGWEAVRHNALIDTLKKGWQIFSVCETDDARAFIIESYAVIEFTSEGKIKVHPAATAPFWAKKTIMVHTIKAKGFSYLSLIESCD